MPRPTTIAAVTVIVGAVLVFLLVGRTGDTPPGDDAVSTTIAPVAVEANAVVDHVVDGDTIDAIIDGTEERVRLIGIDTPETKKPDTPIECFGPEATAFTEQLLPVGTPIRIERDTVGRDDYGRLLGYVYRADDGVFVNYEVLRQGFGTPLSIGPNTTFEQLFVEAARAAETDDVGLWAACSGAER
ncbi:thermonuclease family protein [Ilumatobacter coccineus]|uniref:Putative nuclease n=1 Tax=Ilumatobacter coccineus (strain NBRC 103263 / KCTC 29153 / YM16-304) TaxID=1313172 RepID=A0A6C7E5Y6_ILUCY|nr:thermonuclease family protein [Ilumatobacter coccineus]BAN01853.1 putative nuclease [Ilumatobacter coccineus YM16-304]